MCELNCLCGHKHTGECEECGCKVYSPDHLSWHKENGSSKKKIKEAKALTALIAHQRGWVNPKKKKTYQRVCLFCQRHFVATQFSKKTCSSDCRTRASKALKTDKDGYLLYLPPATAMERGSNSIERLIATGDGTLSATEIYHHSKRLRMQALSEGKVK